MSERDGFLSRWSRRKLDAAAGRPPEPAPPPGLEPAAPPPAPDAQPASPAPLPPVESLTAESDFTPFMAKDVDPELQRSALKTLFRDERFNVMDGLDVYIDDYSKPAPIPAEWYERMTQLAGLGDVPAREAAQAEAKAKQEGAPAALEDAGSADPTIPDAHMPGPAPAAGPAPQTGQADDFKSVPHDREDGEPQ